MPSAVWCGNSPRPAVRSSHAQPLPERRCWRPRNDLRPSPSGLIDFVFTSAVLGWQPGPAPDTGMAVPWRRRTRQDYNLVLAASPTLLGLLIGTSFSMAASRGPAQEPGGGGTTPSAPLPARRSAGERRPHQAADHAGALRRVAHSLLPRRTGPTSRRSMPRRRACRTRCGRPWPAPRTGAPTPM